MLGDAPYGGCRAVRRDRRPVRRQCRDLRRKAGGVALQYEQRDLVEHGLDGARVERVAAGQRDLLRVRGLWALEGVEEVLVELLPRPAADDLDGDVLIGTQARQLDHVAR